MLRQFMALCIAVASGAIFDAGLAANDPNAEIDRLFAAWDAPEKPGAGVMVLKNGKVVHRRNYGTANLEHAIPISSDTKFELASVTKQFTAFSVFLLAKRNRVNLDESVRAYVPELNRAFEKVTIRMMLNNTSGIRDVFQTIPILGLDENKDYISQRDGLSLLKEQDKFNFPPGSEYQYSNSNYILLGEIVERASGRSFRKFLEEEIFEPLGMVDTFFNENIVEIISKRASGYLGSSAGYSNVDARLDVLGADGVFSTTGDMAKWARALLGREFHPDIIDQMTGPGRLNNGERTTYGAGYMLADLWGMKVFGHTGFLGGYKSAFLVLPEADMAVIILGNTAEINPISTAVKTARAFLDDRLGPQDPTDPQEPRPPINLVTLPAADLEKFTGTLRSEESGEVLTLFIEEGRLFESWQGAFEDPEELAVVSDRRLTLKDDPGAVSYDFAEDGAGLTISSGEEVAHFVLINRGADSVSDFAGAYRSKELGATIEFTAAGERLSFLATHNPEYGIHQRFGDHFLWWNFELEFLRDKRGDVTAVRVDEDYAREMIFDRLER